MGQTKLEKIDETDVLEDDFRPKWINPVYIDYNLDETNTYIVHLMNVLDGIETILAEAQFQLAELITSKGSYIKK